MSSFTIQTSFERAPTDQVMNLDSATGYQELDFYFFNSTGVNRFYGRMNALSDADLQAEITQRASYVESEMSMGKTDAPSYGEPWGHTDMFNIPRWEAERRNLTYTRPNL